MKRLLLASTFALALSSAATAEVKTYYRSGMWNNFAGVDNQNEFVCGMDITNRNATQSVHIKWAASTGKFFVQIFKTGWRIPQGTKIPVEIGFDGGYWGNVENAYGTTYHSGTYSWGGIVFGIKSDSVTDFFDNVAAANKMWLRFPNGNETPWSANMEGSRNSVSALKMCIQKVAAQKTQPYSNNNSQPYSSQPTQPYSSPAPAQSTQPYSGVSERVD
jgi:hypothetical protein